jgi:predicted nucleotidyltransferase
MSYALEELAETLDVSERTLRRAWALGTLRGERVTPYKLLIPIQERTYLRRHWSTLARLRKTLRTEPNVSIGVVFGSLARGDDDSDSDMDLLVSLRNPGLRNQVALASRLRRYTDQPIELVTLEDALRRPALMVEILRDGRVLVDRDKRWPELRAQTDDFLARAHHDRLALAERARSALDAFAERVGAQS